MSNFRKRSYDYPSGGGEQNYGKKKDFRNKWEKRMENNEDQWEDVTGPGQPRKYTVSIAVPATILEETCLKDDLRTYVIGQIGRAATIYGVDEVVVYDDRCWNKRNHYATPVDPQELIDMMRILLEYQECPQYLRKHLFEYSDHLRCVGVLNTLNAPHHLRAKQWCKYREGVVMEKGNKSMSFVDVGLGCDVAVDQRLDAGVRVTVKLPPEAKDMKKPYGTIVSPDVPREEEGFYWGFTVRVAKSLSEVVTGSRFTDGYDLLIGTSDKGDDIKNSELPTFKHAMIVFGGVEGLEVAIESDKELEATEPLHLFDRYINTCPNQQSRTIRTEEAIIITLAVFNHSLPTTNPQQ